MLVVYIYLAYFNNNNNILYLYRRRRPSKYGETSGVTKPLIGGNSHPNNDPVELRRLQFQTPAMVSHPPVPINYLAQHIEQLKANDNFKFSQEYESIEPGQQFTWDHSNMDVNKPKNRCVKSNIITDFKNKG